MAIEEYYKAVDNIKEAIDICEKIEDDRITNAHKAALYKQYADVLYKLNQEKKANKYYKIAEKYVQN